MLTVSRKGLYLLVVALVMVFFLPGRIAKADGISDIIHDELSDSGESGDHNTDINHDESKWSDWLEKGDHDDTTWTSNSDNTDSDGPIVGNGNDSNEGGDGEQDVDLKDVDPAADPAGDPAGNSIPEPSSLALLAIGTLGVMSLARRSGVRQLT